MWRLTNKTINPALAKSILRGYGTSPVYVRSGSTRSGSKTQTLSSSSIANNSSIETPDTISAVSGSEPVLGGMSFHDSPLGGNGVNSNGHIDWSDSFHGLGSTPFPSEISEILLAPIPSEEIEIKPDGLLYLPEIKYRRILNRAFGPGGWGLAPRTESYITPKQISREYALICHGRLVSVARGEQDYFGSEERVTTALEGCKSNALMRCCKDLGIASELWDPQFIKQWKAKYCDEVFAEHVTTKKKKKLWKLKKYKTLDYPYKLI